MKVELSTGARLPDLVKIGGTERTAAVRAKELSGPTGTPTPFAVVHEPSVIDWRSAEVPVHKMLAEHRVARSREFFRVTPAEAIRAVDLVAGRLAWEQDGTLEQEIFVAKLDANGNHVWSERFGDAYDQAARSMKVDSAGNVVVTGKSYGGTIDFGNCPLTSMGIGNTFVVKLTP